MKLTDYTSTETAKLLKAVGYPQNTQGIVATKKNYSVNSEDYGSAINLYVQPSLWDAMKWLREEKHITIEIIVWGGAHPYLISVYRLEYPTIDIADDTEACPSYESACDAGISVACKWLLSKKGGEE